MARSLVINNNLCLVRNFTLLIFSNPQDLPSSSIDAFFQQQNFTYEILTLNHKLKANQKSLCLIDGKITFEKNTALQEGFLKIKTRLGDSDIELEFKFEKIDQKNNAYDLSNLLEEINNILNDFENSNDINDSEYQINTFLRPHISGVKQDQFRLDNPIITNYELEGTRVKFLNLPDKNIMENAWGSEFGENNQLIIPVLINDEERRLFWNRQSEVWEIEDPSEIPKAGKIKIGSNLSKSSSNAKYHDYHKLNMMRHSLSEIKQNLNLSGRLILRNLIQSKLNKGFLSTNQTHSNTSELDNILKNYSLDREYEKLDDAQKECILKVESHQILSINGEGGSGKTEVGVLLSIIQALKGKKILIVTETNNALDNFIERIHKLLRNSPRIQKELKIVRLEPQNRRIDDETISKYGLSHNIDIIRDGIEKKYDEQREKNLTDVTLKEIHSEFKTIFTHPYNLERTIVYGYDIILTTYGLISERKYFKDSFHEFDINLVDASSSINFSSFCTSGYKSQKWVFLNDINQISPLTIGDFLLKQPLRFPDKSELQTAIRYDPQNTRLSNSRPIWSNKAYSISIADIINKYESNEILCKIELKHQYRIHPKLFKKISSAFKNEFDKNLIKQSTFLSLNNIHTLLNEETHLSYNIMNGDEIILQMGANVADLVDKIEGYESLNNIIHIGVACTDVDSMRKIFSKFRNALMDSQRITTKSRNHYIYWSNKCKVTFCSIKSHQEREYDIFILGIIKITSTNFRKRIYTSLTRASNYAIVFGPKVRIAHGNSESFIEKNKQILKRLQED